MNDIQVSIRLVQQSRRGFRTITKLVKLVDPEIPLRATLWEIALAVEVPEKVDSSDVSIRSTRGIVHPTLPLTCTSFPALHGITEYLPSDRRNNVSSTAGSIKAISSSVHYQPIRFEFENLPGNRQFANSTIELVGLSQQGELIWGTTRLDGSETISIGDLIRAQHNGFLDYDPTKLVVEVYPRDFSYFPEFSASLSIAIPPDAWRDLVALAAFLVAVANVDDLLSKYGNLTQRIASACLRIGALRDAKKLSNEVPPQRLVRFVRRKQEWRSDKLAKLLHLQVGDAEALLTFCGYEEDRKDGTWKPRLDPASDALYDLATCLLYLIRDTNHQRIYSHSLMLEYAMRAGDLSEFRKNISAMEEQIKAIFDEVLTEKHERSSDIDLAEKLIEAFQLNEAVRARLEASIMALLNDIQNAPNKRKLPRVQSTQKLIKKMKLIKVMDKMKRFGK